MTSSSSTTIYQKDGFVFQRCSDRINHYELHFGLQNPTLHLMRLMDFHFLKLVYDLNPDIYVVRNVDVLDEHHATAVLLLKNFFEDLGLPQRYTHAAIERHVRGEDGAVVFSSRTVQSLPEAYRGQIPADAQLLPLEQMVCTCVPVLGNPHEIGVICEIAFSGDFVIQPFAEKMVGFVLFQVFSRVKQFTEKMRM